MYIPTFDDMLAAHDRIRPHIRLTPVRTSDYLNELTGAQLFFKCENFQEPGAFKVRGASNAVFGLTDEQAKEAWPPIPQATMPPVCPMQRCGGAFLATW